MAPGPSASKALKSLELVVTNSHMPHVSGKDEEAELRQRFPSLPILHLYRLSRPIP